MTGAARYGWLQSRLMLLKVVNPAIAIFLLLFFVIACFDPGFLNSPSIMSFLRRAAPLIILACGQLFVLLSGGFDLSAGALVTMTVIGSSLITGGDPSLTWWAIAACYLIGLAVGITNGVVVSYLRVPSIIATLGMLLIVKGAALAWSGGSPRGYLPENYRVFGRFVWRDVPGLGTLPAAVIVLAVFLALAAWLLHFTNYGRLLLAVGDNPRASQLAGVAVPRIRILAFVFSAFAAVTAGIMLGGFAGVSVGVGDGLELQAIAAAVIGGTQILGGRGSVAGAAAGALTLFALFTLLNLLSLPLPFRLTVQGLVLLGAAAMTVRSNKS